MRIATEVIDIEASPERVFRVVSDIERLPEWAIEFAPRLIKDEGRYRAINAHGEFLVSIEPDRATGVVDMLVGPNDQALTRIPTRVIGIGPDRTVYVFILVGPADLAAEAFEAQRNSIARELVALKSLLEAA